MGIVYHDRQLIRWHVIASPHDEIAEFRARGPIVSSQVKISDANLLAVGHSETPVHSHGFGKGGRVGAGAAASGIKRLVIALIQRGRRQGNIFARTGTRIDCPRVSQLPPCRQVVLPPLTLRVRRKRTSAVGSFFPMDAEPTKIFEHSVDEFLLAALRIKVFIAKNQ